MISIMVQIIIFLIALAAVMLASMWYLRVLLDRMVGSKHRDLETIALTGEVPESWSMKYDVQMNRLREAGKQQRFDRIRRAAKRSHLRRLSRLSEYVRRTRFMENEEIRKHTLRMLQRLDRQWRAEDESVS